MADSQDLDDRDDTMSDAGSVRSVSTSLAAWDLSDPAPGLDDDAGMLLLKDCKTVAEYKIAMRLAFEEMLEQHGSTRNYLKVTHGVNAEAKQAFATNLLALVPPSDSVVMHMGVLPEIQETQKSLSPAQVGFYGLWGQLPIGALKDLLANPGNQVSWLVLFGGRGSS